MNEIFKLLTQAREAGKPTLLTAMTFLDAFGFGCERAGFAHCGGFELPDVLLGLESAKARHPVFIGPSHPGYDGQFGGQPWTSVAKQIREAGLSPDFLAMNPPCSAFAQNGLQRGLEDPIMRCVDSGMRFAFELQPTAFCWELVTGVWTKAHDFVMEQARRAEAHGYHVTILLTTAAVHGGYSNRRRFHFFASKRGFIDYKTIHNNEPAEHRGWKPVGDALGIVSTALSRGNVETHIGFGEETGALRELLQFVPPGTYVSDIDDAIVQQYYKPRGRPWDGKQKPGVSRMRVMPEGPCPTIVGGQTVVHPYSDRWLTPREHAVIMGLPVDFKLSRAPTKAYAECGKGLCVQTARFVALGGLPDAPLMQDGTLGVHVVDLRDMTDPQMPGLSSDDEARVAWFKGRHPTMDPNLARVSGKKGSKTGKPGRPPGSKNRAPVRGSVICRDETVGKILSRIGLATVETAGAAAEIVDKSLKEMGPLAMAIGGAAARASVVIVYSCDVALMLKAMSDKVVIVEDDCEAILECIKIVGISEYDAAVALMREPDLKSLVTAALAAPIADDEVEEVDDEEEDADDEEPVEEVA